MQVFEISGKVEQDGCWSKRDVDFIGYFIKWPGDDVIEGYIEEKSGNLLDCNKYIKGLFINQQKLVFLKLSNNRKNSPIVYSFPNINEMGFWSRFKYLGGFFANHSHQGNVTIRLEKIMTKPEKQRLAYKVALRYNKESAEANRVNRDLMKAVGSLTDFLDEKI